MKHLKRLSLLLAAIMLTTVVQAQVINGDLNHNDGLDVEDITLLIGGYLSGETEIINPAVDPTMVDNSLIAGKWLTDSGDASIVFKKNGSLGGVFGGQGWTYKFMSSQELLLEYLILIYNESGALVAVLKVLELTDEAMLVKLFDGTCLTYTRGKVYEAVDLGLSVKWANMNIGASAPEEYGDHFAWGETTPKDTYSWETYKWCNGSYNSLTKYCDISSLGTVDNKSVLELEDDVAQACWGESWRIPTVDEWNELIEKCSRQWTTQDGVYGQKVTGPNGNSIFLPAAGYRYESSLNKAGSEGDYWSSSLSTDFPHLGSYLTFNSNIFHMSSSYRPGGESVRAVCP